MVPLLNFEVASPRARSLNNPCADWMDDSHMTRFTFFDHASESGVLQRMLRQINPIVGNRFWPISASSAAPA